MTNSTNHAHIKNFMFREVASDPSAYLDQSGCFNRTALAESAADHFGHDEWLDDECHSVWDLAILVGDKFARNN